MSEIAENVVSVAVVDDHPFVHRGLAAVIDLDPALRLAWTSASSEEALAALARNPVDVVILDIKLGSSAGGMKVLEQVKAMEGSAKAIVLSAYVSRRMVSEAARQGASGYFSKTQDVEDTLEAVKRAASDDAGPFLGPYADWARPGPCLELSNREIEVLTELARGRSNPEVAQMLGLKIGTIKTHLESIYRKLGVRSRTEALRVALREGYFYIDEIA